MDRIHLKLPLGRIEKSGAEASQENKSEHIKHEVEIEAKSPAINSPKQIIKLPLSSIKEEEGISRQNSLTRRTISRKLKIYIEPDASNMQP